MPRPSDIRRDEAVALIRQLTAEHGEKEGCRLARERMADISKGTWHRWRVEALGRAPDRQEREREAQAAVVAEVGVMIPVMGNLRIADADAVPAVRRALDFWKMITELDDDAQLLRDYATTVTPEGTRKLRVPFALVQASKLRADMVRLALQHAEVAWSAGRNMQFQQAIIAAIAEVSPDLQKAVLERLRRLQRENEERYGV